MKSLSLGKLLGIKVELHWSFLLIAGLMIASLALFQPQALLPIIVFFSLLFLTVFLHELTHSVVSLQRGFRVKKIVLLPIGGVALSEKLPEKPLDEFLIAASGPIFNFAVALVLLFLVSFFPLPFPENSFFQLFKSFILGSALFEQALLKYPLFALFWINLILGSFNLFLPALPLDGGRVLRSILGTKLGYMKATSIVSRTSTFVALLLFLSVFFLGILAPIIGLIILFGSKEEERLVKLKYFFSGIRVSEAIEKKPLVLKGSTPLKTALKEMLQRKKTIALVKLRKEYGVLSAAQFIEQREKLSEPVSKIAVKTEPVNYNESVSSVLERILSGNSVFIPVLKKGKLAGAINSEKLEKFLQLKRLEKML